MLMFLPKKLHRRCSTWLKIGFWQRVWNIELTLVPSLQIKPKKYWARKYVWRFFLKRWKVIGDSKHMECLRRSSRPQGSLKKMLREISQNPQENISAGISFLLFSCEFCKTCDIIFFPEQHWTTASEYSSINSNVGSTVLVNKTVNYDAKTKTYVLNCARCVIY